MPEPEARATLPGPAVAGEGFDEGEVVRTPVCDVLGIEIPIVCAPFGPWDQVELAAAVSNAGGLGGVGTALRPLPDLKKQWRRLRDLTDGPFVINHTMRPLDEEAFAASVEFGPAALSFHMGVPVDLIERAHDAGILWIQQVIDMDEAKQALAAGVDVLIAQGGEAGGHGGWVSTLVLVPAVVDVAGHVPVLAAGGIADGRGLAAALMLGAQGVSMGTRFLASREMAVSDDWKKRIVEADATDAVKVVNTERILPPFSRPVTHAEPRSLLTPLIDQLADDPDGIDVEATTRAVVSSILAGGGDEYMPFAGQSVGLISEVLPAAEIILRTVEDAERLLVTAPSWVQDEGSGSGGESDEDSDDPHEAAEQ